MHKLTATAFATLLARAPSPVWAGVIAVVPQHRSPEALSIDREEAHQALAAPQDAKP